MPSLAHPVGNLTGFYVFEPSFGAKLLELLKEIAPQVARVAILSNPDANPASWTATAAAAAPKFGVEVVSAPLGGAMFRLILNGALATQIGYDPLQPICCNRRQSSRAAGDLAGTPRHGPAPADRSQGKASAQRSAAFAQVAVHATPAATRLPCHQA